MKKQVLSLICFCLLLVFSSVCYGAKEVLPTEPPKKETYPLGLLKKEQIVEKYFSGRALDFIEGLWEYEPGESVMIVKVAALLSEKEKYADYDYLALDATGKESNALVIHKLKKISPFIYKVNDSTSFKILSSISLVKQQHLSIGWYDYFYVRTYPQIELKTIKNRGYTRFFFCNKKNTQLQLSALKRPAIFLQKNQNCVCGYRYAAWYSINLC